jgi:hypothetical protein
MNNPRGTMVPLVNSHEVFVPVYDTNSGNFRVLAQMVSKKYPLHERDTINNIVNTNKVTF